MTTMQQRIDELERQVAEHAKLPAGSAAAHEAQERIQRLRGRIHCCLAAEAAEARLWRTLASSQPIALPGLPRLVTAYKILLATVGNIAKSDRDAVLTTMAVQGLHAAAQEAATALMEQQR